MPVLKIKNDGVWEEISGSVGSDVIIDMSHNHDDRYYTEVEVDNKISELNTTIDEKLDGYATEQYVNNYAQPKGDYLTEHQDISGKLDASALPTAINTALAQAKASGEFDGKDGYTPVKGKDYFDGSAGNDGTSATHSWNGTVLTITSASGTSSADLKGEKGDKGDSIKGDKGDTGDTGSAGKDGTSVTVQSVSESSADGGSNVVTFSDGKTVTIKNGSKGSAGSNGSNGVSATHSWSGTTLTITSASGTSSANLKGDKGDKGDSIKGDTGAKGADGKTPVKGVDYWTDADKAAFFVDVLDAIKVEYPDAHVIYGDVDSDNNIIISGKLANGTYVLKYENENGTVTEIGNLVLGGIENLADPKSSDWADAYRINSSGALVGSVTGSVVANYIPCKVGDVVRVKGIDIAYYQASSSETGRTNMFYYQSDKATIVGKIVVADNPSIFVNSGDVWTFTVGNGVSGDTSKIAYIRPFGRYMSNYTKNDVIITVNEEIV